MGKVTTFEILNNKFLELTKQINDLKKENQQLKKTNEKMREELIFLRKDQKEHLNWIKDFHKRLDEMIKGKEGD